jgi:heme-degrading monooxygenase HmoA
MTQDEVLAIATLPVESAQRHEFERSFAQLRVLEHARSLEMRGAILLRPSLDGPYRVLSSWSNAEAYAAWGPSDVAARLGNALSPLYQGEAVSESFSIVESSGPFMLTSEQSAGEGR